jgi:hypothetical protein
MAANTLNILKPSVNNLSARIFVRAAGLDFEELDVWGKKSTPELAFDRALRVRRHEAPFRSCLHRRSDSPRPGAAEATLREATPQLPSRPAR